LKIPLSGWTDVRWALLLGAFTFLIHWSFRTESFGAFQDSAHYLSGARALAGGHGYVMSDFVGTPKIGVYAPGWSALLSVVWRCAPEFPANLAALYAFMSLVTAGVAATGFLWMRRLDVAAAPAWLAAALWATTLRTHEFGVWLMSDPALSLVAFLFALAWMSSPDRSGMRWWFYAGVLSLAGVFLRMASLGISLGIGLASLIGAWRARPHLGRMSAVLMLANVPALIFLVGWKLWIRGAYGSAEAVAVMYPVGGFLPWYAEHKFLDLENLVVGRIWGEMFCSPFCRAPAVAERYGALAFWVARTPVILVNAAFTFWVARGLWLLRLRSWAGPLLLVAGVYTAFILLAPMPSAYLNRYLMPVWPILVAAAWAGRPSFRGLRTWTLSVLSLAVLANVAWLPRAQKHWNRIFAMDELKATASWIRETTPPGTRVGVDYALPFLHLAEWSGRPLVVDYYHPRWQWSYVGYRQEGCPPAELILTGNQGYQPSEPPDGATVVYRSSGGHFVVSRPDPILDASRRESICNGSR
jgi:hypothetical protein